VQACREVHDAGDVVPRADVEEGGLVGRVERLDDDAAVGVGGEVLGERAGAVRGDDDGFAEVQQRPCGVRPDRAEAARDEDHLSRVSFTRSGAPYGPSPGRVLYRSAILWQ